MPSDRQKLRGTIYDTHMIGPFEEAGKNMQKGWNRAAFMFNLADTLLPIIQMPDLPMMEMKKGGTTKRSKRPKVPKGYKVVKRRRSR